MPIIMDRISSRNYNNTIGANVVSDNYGHGRILDFMELKIHYPKTVFTNM
jgi:hypothetical protein